MSIKAINTNHEKCRFALLSVSGYGDRYDKLKLSSIIDNAEKMKYRKMSQKQILAAETFAYSYANYADHLDINPRFDEYMPNDIDVIEKVVKQGESAEKIASKLRIDKDDAAHLLESYLIAKEIVSAKNAAESFRRGVKASIVYAIEKGLKTEEDIENLVVQICYRAADFAYLLDLEGKVLSDYSETLREE